MHYNRSSKETKCCDAACPYCMTMYGHISEHKSSLYWKNTNGDSSTTPCIRWIWVSQTLIYIRNWKNNSEGSDFNIINEKMSWRIRGLDNIYRYITITFYAAFKCSQTGDNHVLTIRATILKGLIFKCCISFKINNFWFRVNSAFI